MPRFFFHFRGPDGLEPDEIGLVLPGPDAAFREARHAAPGIMGELIDRGRDVSTCGFRITNSSGRLVMDIPFIDLATESSSSRSFAPSRHMTLSEDPRGGVSLYRGVLEVLPVPVVILTLQLRVIDANQAYLLAMGAQADNLHDRCICEVFPRNTAHAETTDGASLLAMFERALSLGDRHEAATVRYDLCGPDGSWRKRYWRATSWPIADEAGSIIAIANQMLDVTAEVEVGEPA